MAKKFCSDEDLEAVAMEVTVEGDPNEIAALVVPVQERRLEDDCECWTGPKGPEGVVPPGDEFKIDFESEGDLAELMEEIHKSMIQEPLQMLAAQLCTDLARLPRSSDTR